MKKILSLVVALTLMFALAISASATSHYDHDDATVTGYQIHYSASWSETGIHGSVSGYYTHGPSITPLTTYIYLSGQTDTGLSPYISQGLVSESGATNLSDSAFLFPPSGVFQSAEVSLDFCGYSWDADF